MVIIIVVDGKEVSVHICVAHQQVHVGNAVDMLQESIELIELARLGTVQRKAPELCSKLDKHEQIMNKTTRKKITSMYNSP